MDRQGIIEINRRAFDRAQPTDVISFRYDPIPGEQGAGGEIFVNVERAWEEGTRRGNPSRELALYIVHGCLHLAGEDDRHPAGRRRMRRLEQKWLQDASENNYLHDLFLKETGKTA